MAARGECGVGWWVSWWEWVTHWWECRVVLLPALVQLLGLACRACRLPACLAPNPPPPCLPPLPTLPQSPMGRPGLPVSVLVGHGGPASFVDFHPALPDALLSASFDGTCRIWTARDAAAPPIVLGADPLRFGLTGHAVTRWVVGERLHCWAFDGRLDLVCKAHAA